MNEIELLNRIKNAIVLLTDGHSYKVGDLTFSCRDKSHFSVTGWSLMHDLKNVTRDSAISELNKIKELFKNMTCFSMELADFVNGRQIEYHLGFDYGMGAIEICSESDDQLKWKLV
ncbi:hypothetical protein [Paludibacter sp.]|uniref:hypothetical protein n=1 Tax=Paludibacter sp. TaxID=1898105 RepID=UPI001355E77B|nr:hypothetical protein [Paludibacter sp.]MTK52647.1 hypothetical protein [Paludibacter sp.]